MNQNDKMRSALTAVIEHSSRITELERSLVDAKRRREEGKKDVIRVLKALGQQQVLFRGQVYARGTEASPTVPGEDTRDEFLTINKFTGVVLPDGNGSSPQGSRDLPKEG